MRERKLALPDDAPEGLLVGYARCCQLEKWFRELVYLEMKAHFGTKWWTEAEAALKRSQFRGIPPEVSRERDNRHPHMATPETDPLWFISFDALLKIVFDDQLWGLFEPYLTTKELLKAKFTEIAPIRNRIAHYRTLHDDDLDRLRRILRDLDQGFWRFCTSYNDGFPIVGDERSDPFYRQFADRMGFDYVETAPNTWALVGNTLGMNSTVSVERIIRPSANREEAMTASKGKLYDFTVSYAAGNGRSMDFQRILEATEDRHVLVTHVVLDSFQRSLRVTLPAVEEPDAILETAEWFYNACINNYTFSFRDEIEQRIENSGQDFSDDPKREYDMYNRPFEQIADAWPHYVIGPRHPYAFLDSNCPCSFFEA